MSRAGYSDDCDGWSLIRWRGQVASAIRGKRGQAFLRELGEALEAMPEKRLIAHELSAQPPAFISPGFAKQPVAVCALGSIGARRGIDLAELDPEDHNELANSFGIAHQLTREIAFENDEAHYYLTPEQRWHHMREWVRCNLKDAVP